MNSNISQRDDMKSFIGNNYGKHSNKQEFCLNGHERTPDNVIKSGACKKCDDKRHVEKRRSFSGKMYVRGWHLKKRYNLTIEQFNLMWVSQNGKCKICSIELERDNALGRGSGAYSNYVAVDHCHITNTVRGLLCQKCNKGLGSFDSVDKLKSAIKYLEEFDPRRPM